MIDMLLRYLSYGFVRNALIVGCLVALCSSVLGVSLVLRRYSMIGDGLSHVAFGAIAVATVAGMATLAFSVPVVVLSAILLLRISDSSRISGDSAIAMISSGALALGVCVISVSGGVNSDISSYMFGSINAMSRSDVILAISLSAAVLIIYLLFFNRIFAVTFDESFSGATGIKTQAYKMLIATVSGLTVVVGMRVMGALLISALIIFPALTSMRLFKSFRAVVLSSAVISVLCSFGGIMAACFFDLPTGDIYMGCKFAIRGVSYAVKKYIHSGN